MLYGDKKLRKKIEDAGVYTTRLKVQKTVARRSIYTSVVGCAPHVPNYVAGVPVAMINEKKVKVKQKIVTVFYNMAVSGGTSARDIIEACAQLISACMIIEASGVRVNIYAGSVSEDEGQRVGFAIKIKDSGQPFDTLKMCYPLAHPSMNRRHKFRFLEVTKGVKRGWSDGYGFRCNDGGNRRSEQSCCVFHVAIVPNSLIELNPAIGGVTCRQFSSAGPEDSSCLSSTASAYRRLRKAPRGACRGSG